MLLVGYSLDTLSSPDTQSAEQPGFLWTHLQCGSSGDRGEKGFNQGWAFARTGTRRDRGRAGPQAWTERAARRLGRTGRRRGGHRVSRSWEGEGRQAQA